VETYNDVYLALRKRLRIANIEDPDFEARLIVALATGKSREELITSGNMYFADSSERRHVEELTGRRVKGEPLPYVLGEWEFYGIPLIVTKAVIIPRVDTEVRAAEAIRLAAERGEHARLLDLCAGSGCVGLAVAAHVPKCRVVLADNSEKALEVCRANMHKNSITRNATAMSVDALLPPPLLLGTFDVIACNPPYIPSGDIEGLDASVREFEPLVALDGGKDGLSFHRAIVAHWPAVLRPRGSLLVECGVGQAAALRALMVEAGLHDIRTLTDTGGVERVVIGVRVKNA
jgi:release factor glutamine methyltransferase